MYPPELINTVTLSHICQHIHKNIEFRCKFSCPMSINGQIFFFYSDVFCYVFTLNCNVASNFVFIESSCKAIDLPLSELNSDDLISEIIDLN